MLENSRIAGLATTVLEAVFETAFVAKEIEDRNADGARKRSRIETTIVKVGA